MADTALGGVEKIVRAGLAIKKAAATARRNKKECRDIERCVARVSALLSLLKQSAMVDHPAIRGPLDDLAESVQEASDLVRACRGTTALLRLWGAGDTAKQLRRVQDDILQKLALQNFASAVHITIALTSIIPYGRAHPLLMQPQLGVGTVPNGMASICEVPYSSPSGGLSLSGVEVSTHHFTGEGTKQKIVLSVNLQSAASRSEAKALVGESPATLMVSLSLPCMLFSSIWLVVKAGYCLFSRTHSRTVYLCY